MKLLCLEHDREPVTVEFKDDEYIIDGKPNFDAKGTCPKCNKTYTLRKLLTDVD